MCLEQTETWPPLANKGKSSSKINAFSQSGCKAICSVLTICLSHTHIQNLSSMFDLFTVLTNTCLSYTQTSIHPTNWKMPTLPSCMTPLDVVTWTRALPAFSVWDRLLLLLAGDEGGPPHRTAVAGSEPAHGRRGGKRSGAEPVI